MCAMNGSDANEPSRMAITCFLSLFNKHFLSFLPVPSTSWENIWQINEKLELVRPSEVRKKRGKCKRHKGFGKGLKLGVSGYCEKWLYSEIPSWVPGLTSSIRPSCDFCGGRGWTSRSWSQPAWGDISDLSLQLCNFGWIPSSPPLNSASVRWG